MEERQLLVTKKSRRIVLVLALLLGSFIGANADELVDGLRSLPMVESVQVFQVGESPKARLIHIMDWHFVPVTISTPTYAINRRPSQMRNSLGLTKPIWPRWRRSKPK